MAEVGEPDRQHLHQLGQSLKEQFDEFWSVDLKSKKVNGPTIFTIGRTKLYFIQIKNNKAAVVATCPLPFLTGISSAKSDDIVLTTKHIDALTISSSKATKIIHALRIKIFSEVYPGMNEKDNPQISVKVPEDRLEDLPKIDRPCGNFKGAYLAECEATETPVREDIAFDVEHLLSANNVKDFNLEEFEGITPNDVKCLLAALRFNPYFTSLKLRNVKLEKDQALAVTSCLRTNRVIDSISLGGLTANKDFYVELFTAMQANKQCVVREIYLADSKEFGDTGATQLSNWVAGLPHGVSVVDLSNCGIRGKGIVALCNAFKKNVQVATTLTHFNINHNRIEAEGSSALSAFLAQPNALTHLNLRDCAASLDLVLGALNRGTSREIRELDISVNKVTPKSSHLSVFVRSSSTISKLNVSATGFTPDMFKELLMGIHTNPYLNSVELVASKNALGVAGARVIKEIGADMNNITTLDLSDNEFDDEAMTLLCQGLEHCTSVVRLDLSRNLPSSPKKGHDRHATLDVLLELIRSPQTSLRQLGFCGAKGTQLGHDLVNLFGAMEDAVITGLDISGQNIGNKGASSLGKMLQTNHTLASLTWDENGTTLVGFKNFRKGLKRNTALKSMPLPILDIEAALSKESDKSTLLKVIHDIEACVVHNNSPKSKFKAKDKAQGNDYLFFATSEREALEQHIILLKSKGKKPSEEDQIAIKDAENYETVVGDLHVARTDALKTFEEALKPKLQTIAEELQPLLAQHLGDLRGKMIDIIRNGYPSLDSDTVRRIGTYIAIGTRQVDLKELQEVMVGAAGADIVTKTNESYQSAVDIASDYCFERLRDNLIEITDRLQNEVEDDKKPKKKKKHSKEPSDSVTCEGSSSSLATSSASTAKKDKKPKVVVEESSSSSEEEPATVVEEEDEEQDEVTYEEDVSESDPASSEAPATSEPATTEAATTEPGSGTATPPAEPSPAETPLGRGASTPNIVAPPLAAANMGGSASNIGSSAPKKAPPALPKAGPPPTPKWGGKGPGTPPPSPSSGGGPPHSDSSAPTTPTGAPKGGPPKLPSGFPPKTGLAASSGTTAPPAAAADGPPKPVPGKLNASLVQNIKLGPPIPGGGPPPRPAGAAPPMPAVSGPPPGSSAPPTPVVSAAAKKTSAPAASPPTSTKDDKKDKKDAKDAKDKKEKKRTSAKRPAGKAKPRSESFVVPVTSQGAASGLSAANTTAAPEGAIDKATAATGGPMADPRLNRSAGAAKRRPPTRRPQGPPGV